MTAGGVLTAAQDARVSGCCEQLVSDALAAGVRHAVVNGTCEADWAAVTSLCERHPAVCLASFGLHPWRVRERSPDWAATLEALLRANERAAVGEAGLHCGASAAPLDEQRDVLRTQLRLAATLRRPLSLHCVGAAQELLEDLRSCAPPSGYAAGVLLHGFTGGADWVPRFRALGAVFFSFSAASARPKTSALLRAVPDDSILLETDAPDGLPRNDNLDLASCGCGGLRNDPSQHRQMNTPVRREHCAIAVADWRLSQGELASCTGKGCLPARHRATEARRADLPKRDAALRRLPGAGLIDAHTTSCSLQPVQRSRCCARQCEVSQSSLLSLFVWSYHKDDTTLLPPSQHFRGLLLLSCVDRESRMRVSASPPCPAPPCCKARRIRSAPRRLCVRAAAEEETDLVTRWVGQIFGKKAINDPAPAGLARMTREEWPDQWPPVTDEFAALLEGDTGEVVRLRPLLRQTQLEFQPLALAFDADVHGWSTSAFHTQLDGMGAAVLVLETRGGESETSLSRALTRYAQSLTLFF